MISVVDHVVLKLALDDDASTELAYGAQRLFG